MKYFTAMFAFSLAVFCRGKATYVNSDIMDLLLYKGWLNYKKIRKAEAKNNKNQIYDKSLEYPFEISKKQKLQKYHNRKSEQNT